MDTKTSIILYIGKLYKFSLSMLFNNNQVLVPKNFLKDEKVCNDDRYL